MKTMLIRLEPKEKLMLKKYSKTHGLSEAASVRHALDLMFKMMDHCVTCGRKK